LAAAGEAAGYLVTLDENSEAMATPSVNGYTMEVQDLSEAIRGERAPRCAWESLDANMRVTDACSASHKTGLLTTV
jgi:hypothetical protein